jgi:peptide/nickel transport system ATP-binding protein
VSVTLKRGQVTGIVGESGSGKSVLGMAILRLLPDNADVSGKIIFEGENILAKSEKDMLKLRGSRLGLIPQSPSESLNPAVKIRRQVTEIFTLRKRVPNAEESARKLLERFQLPDVDRCMNGYGFQLSGGMKQRVVTAFGVGASPEWIIADEPTKGLDSVLAGQVREVLREISKTANMLLITHDLSLAQSICDVVIVMNNGHILEQGDILKNPYHQYTKGLLESTPAGGMKAMPLVQDAPDGDLCPICGWCPQRESDCNKQLPPLAEVDGRKVRCWRYA